MKNGTDAAIMVWDVRDPNKFSMVFDLFMKQRGRQFIYFVQKGRVLQTVSPLYIPARSPSAHSIVGMKTLNKM